MGLVLMCCVNSVFCLYVGQLISNVANHGAKVSFVWRIQLTHRISRQRLFTTLEWRRSYVVLLDRYSTVCLFFSRGKWVLGTEKCNHEGVLNIRVPR